MPETVSRGDVSNLIKDAAFMVGACNTILDQKGVLLIFKVGDIPEGQWPNFTIQVVSDFSKPREFQFTHDQLLPTLSMALALADILANRGGG